MENEILKVHAGNSTVEIFYKLILPTEQVAEVDKNWKI